MTYMAIYCVWGSVLCRPMANLCKLDIFFVARTSPYNGILLAGNPHTQYLNQCNYSNYILSNPKKVEQI